MARLPSSLEMQARLTAISLDGNTLKAATLSRRAQGVYSIDRLKTLELEDVIQRYRRANHPIYMHVDYLEFPDPGLLEESLQFLLDEDVFDTPYVGVYPALCSQEWRRVGNPRPERVQQRLQRGFRMLQSPHPQAYPRVFGYEVAPVMERAEVEVRTWCTRFDDVVVSAEQYLLAQADLRTFGGMVTVQRAYDEVLGLMSRAVPREAFTILDIGRMATMYAGAHDKRSLFCHGIPIGQSRIDQLMLDALPQTRITLEAAERGGPLVTAGVPLASRTGAQLQAMLLADEIARFAKRAVKMVGEEVRTTVRPRMILAGLGSRLRGLEQVVKENSDISVTTLDSQWLPGLHLGRKVSWKEVPDYLVPIGAALAGMKAQERRYGTILRDRQPVLVSGSELGVMELNPADLYLIDQPLASGSGVMSMMGANNEESITDFHAG